MNRPTVSIVLPTYNRAQLLPRAIASIEAQTFTDWELILVDDGSTDDTKAVATGFAARLGGRMRYISRPNGGCGAARNTGIDAARGEFVAFLDSDDEFLPTKLARQLELFALRPELGLVYSDYSFIDVAGVRHASVFDEMSPIAREVPAREVADGLHVCTGSLFDSLIRSYFVATIVGMVRREVLGDRIRWEAVGAYAEEWLFFLRVARACRAGFVDEPLCLHHHVVGSLTRTDRLGNTRRSMKLLRCMATAFPDLSPAQRGILADHMATASRQIGYDAYRAGRFGEAARWFVESFYHRPSRGTIGEGIQALGRCLIAPVMPKRTSAAADQDLARTVR
jgi:glycosyltransferase involved in cell wall biosynthesis